MIVLGEYGNVNKLNEVKKKCCSTIWFYEWTVRIKIKINMRADIIVLHIYTEWWWWCCVFLSLLHAQESEKSIFFLNELEMRNINWWICMWKLAVMREINTLLSFQYYWNRAAAIEISTTRQCWCRGCQRQNKHIYDRKHVSVFELRFYFQRHIGPHYYYDATMYYIRTKMQIRCIRLSRRGKRTMTHWCCIGASETNVYVCVCAICWLVGSI